MNKKEFTIETFDTMLDKVVFWNSLAGNSVEDKSLIPMYLTLSREEMFGANEFLQGWFNGDKVMQADGVADLVFTVGFLARLREDNHPFLESRDWDTLRVDESVAFLSTELIVETCCESFYDGLFGLCYKMSEYMDVEEIFNKVYESNMSKFLYDPDFTMTMGTLDGETYKIEDEGRYGDLEAKRVGDYWILLAGRDLRENKVFPKAKIVKPSTFFEPKNLEKFIY